MAKDSRTDYKNQHKATKYDRLEVVVPFGTKDRLKEISSLMGISLNDYICRLIKADIDQDHKEESMVSMLVRWEVKEKYHPMIESASYTKSQGYYIRLKKGFINDHSGTQEIMCKNTRLLRHIMQYTHPVRNPEELCGFDSKTYEQLVRWQVPKSNFKDIDSIGDHKIFFKDGQVWEFKSVSDLRYMWKGR